MSLRLTRFLALSIEKAVPSIVTMLRADTRHSTDTWHQPVSNRVRSEGRAAGYRLVVPGANSSLLEMRMRAPLCSISSRSVAPPLPRMAPISLSGTCICVCRAQRLSQSIGGGYQAAVTQ